MFVCMGMCFGRISHNFPPKILNHFHFLSILFCICKPAILWNKYIYYIVFLSFTTTTKTKWKGFFYGRMKESYIMILLIFEQHTFYKYLTILMLNPYITHTKCYYIMHIHQNPVSKPTHILYHKNCS